MDTYIRWLIKKQPIMTQSIDKSIRLHTISLVGRLVFYILPTAKNQMMDR